jgi:peptide/nickel transport system substrate-binding protein
MPTGAGRASAVLLGAAGLAASALACRATPAAAPGTVTLAIESDTTGFFPSSGVNEAFSSSLNQNLFEGLVALEAPLRIVPALAESWENPDERTYRFVLREGQRFSDGRPVTARDVAASLQAALRRSWENRDYLRAIASVRTIDERRLEIETRASNLNLLTRLPWGYVLPAEDLERSPVPPVGTGPYRLESREPGTGFVLARNPHHRGAAPAFQRARFVVVPEPERRIAMVERGEAQLANNVPLDRVEALRRSSRARVFAEPGLLAFFLCLRVDAPPFSDPRLREALDLALDREELVRRALAGQGEPASQLVPHVVLGFNPQLEVRRPDRGRARRLLAEAGFGGGLELRLDGPANRYVNGVQVLSEVARQLAEVGVRVRVNAPDKLAFYRLIDSGASRLHLLGWACLSGDAGDVLDSLLHSPVDPAVGGWNTLGLRDAALDRLIDQAHESGDSAVRNRALQAAVARVAELRVVLPLAYPHEAFALSPEIEWAARPDHGLRPAELRPAPRS